jgi:hypothetical protein
MPYCPIQRGNPPNDVSAIRAYEFPSENGVAILAGNVQVAAGLRVAAVPRAWAFDRLAIAPTRIPAKAQSPNTLRLNPQRHRTTPPRSSQVVALALPNDDR